MTMKPFKGQVELGKTYLDTWGRPQWIFCHVILQRGWASERDIVDKNKVASTSGWHFNIKTGDDGYGHQLVQLPPVEELAFWRERMEQIISVNHADNLKLVEENLQTMRERISELSKSLCG